jgi:hypothetical protein
MWVLPITFTAFCFSIPQTVVDCNGLLNVMGWLWRSLFSSHPVLTPDFIPAGDFIIEDDLFHPQGWI